MRGRNSSLIAEIVRKGEISRRFSLIFESSFRNEVRSGGRGRLVCCAYGRVAAEVACLQLRMERVYSVFGERRSGRVVCCAYRRVVAEVAGLQLRVERVYCVFGERRSGRLVCCAYGRVAAEVACLQLRMERVYSVFGERRSGRVVCSYGWSGHAPYSASAR